MATKYDVAISARRIIDRGISETSLGIAVDFGAKLLKEQGFTVPRSLSEDVKAGVDAVARQGGYGPSEALRRYSELY
jgi:hypothetical protein